MTVRFFGRLGDLIGREVRLDPSRPAVSVAELRRLLARQFPHAEGDIANPSVRACVGDRIVGEDYVVEPDAEVEFFPPLSGG